MTLPLLLPSSSHVQLHTNHVLLQYMCQLLSDIEQRWRRAVLERSIWGMHGWRGASTRLATRLSLKSGEEQLAALILRGRALQEETLDHIKHAI